MIVHSVWDRLTGPDEPVGADEFKARNAAQRARTELELFRAQVRGDLEALLNTRRVADPVRNEFSHVLRSVFCYGLPDFSHYNLFRARNEEERDRLARSIAYTIELFEPRILNVTVTLIGQPSGGSRVHFQVAGRLKVEPRPEPVCFDTVLDVNKGDYEVLGAGRA